VLTVSVINPCKNGILNGPFKHHN
jgi:hypothetical protein